MLTIFSGPVPTPFIMMCLIGNSRKEPGDKRIISVSLGSFHLSFGRVSTFLMSNKLYREGLELFQRIKTSRSLKIKIYIFIESLVKFV